MLIELIASDLDRTFVDDDKRVPELNAHAVRLAAERGIPFVFATGRPTRWLEPLRELSDAHPWAIASNGAVTLELDTGRVVHTRPVETATLLDVARDIRSAVPDVMFAVEYADRWGAESGYPERGGEQPGVTGPFDELVHVEPVVKLLALSPSTPTDPLYEQLHEVIGDRLTTTFSFLSDAGMLEISAPGVSKALALAELMAELHIEPVNAIAFGDMPNDRSMLELVGKGYTVARAHHSLIDAGFEIAGDNNDGAVGATVLKLLNA